MNNNITKGKWEVVKYPAIGYPFCIKSEYTSSHIALIGLPTESDDNMREAEMNAKAISLVPHMIDIMRENEELKAQCETYKKDYESMVAEVLRLSRENSKMLEK